MSLAIGDPAPPFSLPLGGGGTFSLDDFRGRKLVLFFYPKDDTSGCTREAKDFTALKAEFASAGTEVVGIAPGSPASKARFARKHALGIELAADETQETLGRYGVWTKKSLFGHKYMGVERTTVLVDRDGRIARIWPNVSVDGHAAEVLAAARAL